MTYALILYETAFRPRARGSDHRFASRHMASPAASPAATAAAPQTWASAAVAFGTTQRILKVRPYWLDKILMGAKHLEIRGSPCPHVGWVSLATTGSQQVMCRVRFGPSRALTAVEEDDNREALAATGYARPWAWPIEEMQLLPQPVQVPPAVARGCVQWITRARWEAFDSEAASRAPNAGARWLTPPSLDAAESRAVEARSGEGAVRRRLRGKQPDALGAYPAQPGLRRKRSPSRKALVGKRPAGCRKNTFLHRLRDRGMLLQHQACGRKGSCEQGVDALRPMLPSKPFRGPRAPRRPGGNGASLQGAARPRGGKA